MNGSGGKGGATAGAGGTTSRAPDAGVIDAPLGGKAGSGGGTGGTGGQGGGGTAGSKGGTSTSGGSTAGNTTGGTDGGVGGTGGSSDAGTEPTTDGPVDKPIETPDVPLDINSKLDVTQPDTTKIYPEVTPPDVTPDVTPDRQPPDTGFDAPSCIQAFRANGYSVAVPTDAGVNACSECRENGAPKEAPCKAIIDCLAAVWVCSPRTASCWTKCRNDTPGGDMVVDDCVATLVGKACP